jgi:hypothetical protein
MVWERQSSVRELAAFFYHTCAAWSAKLEYISVNTFTQGRENGNKHVIEIGGKLITRLQEGTSPKWVIDQKQVKKAMSSVIISTLKPVIILFWAIMGIEPALDSIYRSINHADQK